MTEDDVSFVNMDSWKGGGGSKFGLTFKQIILQHVQRVVVNGSTEFRGGYQREVLHGNYTTLEYVPDSREVYCNSVRMLRALLLCYFDTQMKNADAELEEKFKQLSEEYKKQRKEEENKRARAIYQEDRIELFIRLFEELVMLSKRLNFFEEESVEEEI